MKKILSLIAVYVVPILLFGQTNITLSDGEPTYFDLRTEKKVSTFEEFERALKDETITLTFSGFGTFNTVIYGKSNGKIYANNLPATKGFQLENYGKIRILGGSKKLQSRFVSGANLLGEIVLKSWSQGGVLTVSCDKTME